jgi:LPXTG-site transpeptidase (sortase) family protein
MFKFHIFVMLIGGLLALLGLTISVDVAIGGISDTRPTISPFDQADDIIASDGGFTATFDAIMSDPKDQGQSASQFLTVQDQAATAAPVISTPAPTWIPDRLFIPAIELDTPVIPAELRIIEYNGEMYPQWKAPNSFAAGWSPTSGSPGRAGNTVLFGHHNSNGKVFANLIDLDVNDVIVIYSGETGFVYSVMLIMILEEGNEPLDVRLENARWILPSQDERLTLLTCWPDSSNTHRLIIVASPLSVVSPRHNPSQPEYEGLRQ